MTLSEKIKQYIKDNGRSVETLTQMAENMGTSKQCLSRSIKSMEANGVVKIPRTLAQRFKIVK